jgi:hypothetical protein
MQAIEQDGFHEIENAPERQANDTPITGIEHLFSLSSSWHSHHYSITIIHFGLSSALTFIEMV